MAGCQNMQHNAGALPGTFVRHASTGRGYCAQHVKELSSVHDPCPHTHAPQNDDVVGSWDEVSPRQGRSNTAFLPRTQWTAKSDAKKCCLVACCADCVRVLGASNAGMALGSSLGSTTAE